MTALALARSRSSKNLITTEDALLSLCPDGPVPARRFRLVVLGPAKVGKTALVERFLGRPFPVRHRPTVEELHEVVVDLQGAKVTLEILDTSGTYHFPAMRRLTYEKGDAFLLVYSVEDAWSFESLRSINVELKDRREKKVPVLVVANKSDLTPALSSAVTEAVVRLDWEYPYAQCSAIKDREVVSVFSRLLAELIKQDDALHGPSQHPTTPKKKQKRGLSLPYVNASHLSQQNTKKLLNRKSCVIS